MLGMLAKGLVERKGADAVQFFDYGETENEYLSSRDPRLARIIKEVGHVYEYVDPNLYVALVRNIIGQQISIPVYERTWDMFQKRFGDVPSPRDVLDAGIGELRSLGIASRRAEYILGVSEGFLDGSIDEDRISHMDDVQAMEALDSIRGIGPWTAEMVMLFCLQRKDVFSYGDIALLRGIKRIYGVDTVTKEFFEELRRRFSPYCSVASFYIWEVGEGRVQVHTD